MNRGGRAGQRPVAGRALGRTTQTWGEAPEPTEYLYDDLDETIQGGPFQRVALKTFRGGSNWANTTWPGANETADTTLWTYDPATGLLTGKTNADTETVSHSYTSDGKLHIRTSARGVTTTYGYDDDTGELLTVTYSDGTPGVTYAYTRLGRLDEVVDAAGTREFDYNDDLTLQKETFDGGLFDDQVVTQVYETTGTGMIPGRWAGVQVGTSQTPDADYAAEYSYDPSYGRLSRVTGPGLPATGTVYGAYYTYGTNVADGQGGYDDAADSDMVAKIDIKDDDTVIAGTLRAVEERRDVLTAVVNTVDVDTISKYEYVTNSLGLRTAAGYSGTAFDDPQTPIGQSFGYNDRNELVASQRDDYGASTWAYAYDPIGNRTQYAEYGEDPVYFCTNNLNQYQTLTEADDDCPPTAAFQTFSYDDDGNMTAVDKPSTSDDRTYVWDGENRLIEVRPTTPATGNYRYTYTYDYRGRRVRKRAYQWNSGTQLWTESTTLGRRFVWDGWRLLLERRESGSLLHKYTWGLDLAGQNGSINSLEGAGTIGGLLALHTNGALDMVYCYDGNGNVGQLVEITGQEVFAAYEYDPYGNLLAASGDYYASNPFRFSTKCRDAETEFYYFGYRYYAPFLGRWINRDPIEELGHRLLTLANGLPLPPRRFSLTREPNLYVFVRNAPMIAVDYLGLHSVGCRIGTKCHEVEMGVTVFRNLDPDDAKEALAILPIVEVLGAVGDPSDPRAFIPGFPSATSTEITVAFAKLMKAMGDSGALTVWSRHRCKQCRCSQKRVSWIPFTGGITETHIHWEEISTMTKWAKCTLVMPDYATSGMYGMSEEQFSALIQACAKKAEENAEEQCRSSQRCP